METKTRAKIQFCPMHLMKNIDNSNTCFCSPRFVAATLKDPASIKIISKDPYPLVGGALGVYTGSTSSISRISTSVFVDENGDGVAR